MTARSTNKHGLSRAIPAAVTREVRQRDGFGCVLCGFAIYTYEHVDPTFADATSHDPACITLLCASCHDRVTRGLLSKASVRVAMASPKCKETGFSYGPFDVGPTAPTVEVGPVVARNVPVVIRAVGDDLLIVEPPEAPGGPFRISASLSNRAGTEVLRIVRNEWQTPSSNWDVQVQGAAITINNAPGDVALVLRAKPPNGVVLERLQMVHRGVSLQVSKKVGLTVRGPTGAEFSTSHMVISDMRVALDVRADGSITIGQGGGSSSSVYIGSMTLNSRGQPSPAGVPHVASTPPTTPPNVAQASPAPHVRSPAAVRRTSTKVQRNAPCPCNSGLKFKRCCGA